MPPLASMKVGPCAERISAIQEADKSLPKRQRHTAQLIFEVFRARGLHAIKDAVRDLKKASREVFAPLRSRELGMAHRRAARAPLWPRGYRRCGIRCCKNRTTDPLPDARGRELAQLLINRPCGSPRPISLVTRGRFDQNPHRETRARQCG